MTLTEIESILTPYGFTLQYHNGQRTAFTLVTPTNIIIDVDKFREQAQLRFVQGLFTVSSGSFSFPHPKFETVFLRPIERIVQRMSVPEDDPELDGTEGAHPAWWRGQEVGVRGAVVRLKQVLAGEDDGSGVNANAGLEEVRRKLLAYRTALKPFAEIEFPNSVNDATWVAKTYYCNNQITAFQIRAARAALASIYTLEKPD